MKKKIYHKVPLPYRQWRRVRTEMLQVVFIVAGLVALELILSMVYRIVFSIYGIPNLGL